MATEIQNNKNLTLNYDETSKFGKKEGFIQITAENNTVGLFNEDTGSSERMPEKPADNLGEITKSDELSKLLLNIKNAMTDIVLMTVLMICWRSGKLKWPRFHSVILKK